VTKAAGGGSESAALKLGKAPRVIRVVRSAKMLKVLRVMKLGRLIDEMREVCPASIIMMQMSKLVFITSFFLHINACCFSMVASSQDRGESWTDSYDFEDNWSSEYINALYWATTTCTTVGYGDISPVSDSEKTFGIVSMAISVGIYGYIIGSMTDVITSNSHINNRYGERMDEIFEFVRRYKLPPVVRRGIVDYYRYHFSHKTWINETEILNGLTPVMLETVRGTMLKSGLSKIRLFRTLDKKFFTRLVGLLIPRELVKEEDVASSATGPCPEFFVITEGVTHLYKPTYNSAFTKGAKTHEERLHMIIELVKDMFDQYDDSNDGKLGSSELKGMFDALTKIQHTDTQIERMLVELDADSSGDIEMGEFTTWFMRHKVETLDNRELGTALAKCELNRPYGIWNAFNLGSGTASPFTFVTLEYGAFWSINAESLVTEFQDETVVLRLIDATLVVPAREYGYKADLMPEKVLDARTNMALYSKASDEKRSHELKLLKASVYSPRVPILDYSEFFPDEEGAKPIDITQMDSYESTGPTPPAKHDEAHVHQAAEKVRPYCNDTQRINEVAETLNSLSNTINTRFTAMNDRHHRADAELLWMKDKLKEICSSLKHGQ